MILNEDESRILEGFMANPFYRGIVENAPNEACRNYIVFGLIHGMYCGYDPVRCSEHLEDGLTADDWRYIKKNLAGNNPFLPKCITRIKELDKQET